MCLASKSIPLKDKRAETVAEAIAEIFNCTGVPIFLALNALLNHGIQ
jgi:hypothetical protein